MNIIILISNRLIKIIGHIAKALGALFHLAFPKKRFTIPEKAKALFKPETDKKIPAIIWQTNFTNQVTLPVYLNYLFNRLMSMRHEYRFMITEAREKFIKDEYSDEIYNSYRKLNIGASQADFWRILALNKYGGIYIDIDGHLVWPASLLNKPDDSEIFLKLKRGTYTNYFIASVPNNPNLQKMIKIIVNNIQNHQDKHVYELTGPLVLDEALKNKEANSRLYRYTCVQGSFTNEHFQYIDKAEGKWTRAKLEDVLKKD